MDRYIIDFYCPEARLAIEVDGGGHNFVTRESLDEERTRFLAIKNILLLRFWNHQINEELDSVMETILSALEHRKNPKLRTRTDLNGLRAKLPQSARAG